MGYREIKPRIILATQKESRRGESFKRFFIIFLAFVIGVFVGTRIGNINLMGDATREVIRGKVLESTSFEEGNQTEEKDFVKEESVSMRGTPSNEKETLVADPSKETGASEQSTIESNFKDAEIYTNSGFQKAIDNRDWFTVQVGAYKNIERAKKAENILRSKGYDPYIMPYTNSLGESWFLVRIGKFDSREEAKGYSILFQNKEGIEALVEKLE